MPRHNLPARPTPLIGRDGALAAATARLLDPHVRLLTFTGPGGTGKTRLAIELAATLRDAFADGVWLVDLSPVSDVRLVPSAMARTLTIETSGDGNVMGQLAQALENAESLL